MAGKRYAKKPAKRRKGSNVLINLLIVLCLGVMVFCGYQLVTSYLEYKTGDDAYATLTESAVKKVVKAPEGSQGQVNGTEGEGGGAEEGETALEVDFDVLSGINGDVAAWLYSEGTVIDYPVVQGTDNAYYLDHIFDGTYNKLGALFVDCRNTSGFADRNTIVYGHNMNNGSMFASLTKYADQSYYDEHPEMLLVLPEQTYRVELFSGYVTPGNSDTYQISFADDAAFSDYLENVTAQSDFVSDVSVTSEDRIVTLSTCTYDYEEARYVVHGKLTAIE